MPRNASLVPERSHVVAFSRWAGSWIQHRWSTIAFRPLVVVMTCARCKRCPGLRMAGFRKFQQTSCITHKVFLAVEVCTPAMPFHTRLADDDLHDQGFPKRSARILIFSKPPEMYILCFCKTMFCSTAGSDKPRAFRGVPPAALGRTALGWIDLLNLEEGMVFRQLSIQGSDVLRQNGMIKWTVYSNMAVFSLLDLGRYLIGVRRQQRKHNVERNYGS